MLCRGRAEAWVVANKGQRMALNGLKRRAFTGLDFPDWVILQVMLVEGTI